MDVEKGAQATEPTRKTSEPTVGAAYVYTYGFPKRNTADETTPLSDEAQAVLDNVRSQTGFASYRAYLESHKKDYPSFKNILDPHHLRIDVAWSGAVLNLGKNGGLSTSEYCDSDPPGQCTRVVEALCHPPLDAELQIVLLDIPVNHVSPENLTKEEMDLLDFLGLGFQLDPKLLRSIFASPRFARYNTSLDLDRYHSAHMTMGNIVVTTSQPRLGPLKMPIVLVTGQINAELQHLLSEFDRIRPSPPFESTSFTKPACGTEFSIIYQLLFNHLLDQNKRMGQKATTSSLMCFLPIVQMKILQWRRTCSEQREHLLLKYPEPKDSSLYDRRARLRRKIDRMENDWCSFSRYIRTQHGHDWSKGQVFGNIEAEVKEVIADACRLEGQIRDHLQLEAGKLGLEESRKSIEMSNRQIEEAKRVKLFTILAFVYVPLNLATSIFGMNLQQLNGSGKPLKDFITTAFVALAITGGIWFLIEQFNTYRNWQKDEESTSKPSHSLLARMRIVFWLWQHGHWPWMKQWGAWWRIPLDTPYPLMGQLDIGNMVGLISILEYAAMYSQPIKDSRGTYFRSYAFEPEDRSESISDTRSRLSTRSGSNANSRIASNFMPAPNSEPVSNSRPGSGSRC